MNHITADSFREAAKKYGADACYIADISRFDDLPKGRNPRDILPWAKCVICLVMRVPRALLYDMSTPRQRKNYVSLGVDCLDEDYTQLLLLRLAGIIEDNGYDACVQRGTPNLKRAGDPRDNPEVGSVYELKHARAVREDLPAPDVLLDFPDAAKRCGAGDIGLRGNFLSERFGPLARLAFIITDAPLACDEPVIRTLCDRCGDCIRACGYVEDNAACANAYRGEHPSQRGYSACACGRVCDLACLKHLREKGVVNV